MLFLVATPIGNLQDWSERAKETVQKADLVVSEDTRVSQRLLSHYGIDRKLTPYHKFNEKKSLESLVDRMRKGETLALLSDAGTPCLNDPGQLLVDACHEAGLPVFAVPGPCSPIQALILSGFPFERFQVIGFLPKKPKEALQRALYYPGVTVALESPQRLLSTLETLAKLAPARRAAVARELTKLHEECVRGTAEMLLERFKKKPPKGEIVFVLEEGPPPEEEEPLEETVAHLQETFGLPLREAIKQAAKLRKIPKRLLYQQLHGIAL